MPPNGTAGFARSAVSGQSRLPSPPARTMPRTPRCAMRAILSAGPSLAQVRVGLLTREWPPDVYGGAGVHVEFLARELDRLVDPRVETFAAHGSWDRLDDANATLQVLATDLSMAAAVADRDLVHSHTWYANLGGHLAKLLHGLPHVMTSHSLEPLRPWKAEQLGGGYRVSSWAEKTAIEAADAVIAVSHG